MRGGPQVDLPKVPTNSAGAKASGSMGPPTLPVPHPVLLPDAGGPSVLGGPSPGSGSGIVPLRRTRSGSKLVPDEDRARMNAAAGVPVPFSVDVDKAGHSGMGMLPNLQRSNTSFFKDLVASELFSPSSREMSTLTRIYKRARAIVPPHSPHGLSFY